MIQQIVHYQSSLFCAELFGFISGLTHADVSCSRCYLRGGSGGGAGHQSLGWWFDSQLYMFTIQSILRQGNEHLGASD